jgi:signal transduction histidine kinase
MRAISTVLAVIGGCALVVAVVIELATGDPAGAGWVLVGPAPFYAVGLAGASGAFRGPARRVAVWLLATGTMFLLAVCLDAVLPLVHGWSFAWVISLVRAWASDGSAVAGIGLIGLFPTGTPQRAAERWLLWAATAVAVALPVLLLVASPTAPKDTFPGVEPAVTSPLFVPAASPLEPVAAVLYYTFAAWAVVGVIMLYLRYRRSPAEDRRRIRWLLAGAAGALVTAAALFAVALLMPDGFFAAALIVVLWMLTVAFVLGSLIAALSQDGVLGIDQSSRRSEVYQALWLLIAVGYVAAATTLGLVAGQYLPLGVVVLLVAAAALLFQPAQRRLERLADRWVFGARLDGYEVLTRFGAMLETSPGPADLLPRLAAAIRDGLGLRWARVRLDFEAAGGSLPMTAAAGLEPGDAPESAFIVALIHGGTALGQIECGDRRDGPLLDEDRRLLANLAGQAAAAAHNLYLTAELSDRLDLIRRQATELTASRARVAQTQDAERQRIQRDLHDGVQQDLVALTANLALARERLRRGDPRADESLAELQRDMGDLIGQLRDFAHAIHPPVLADQGLLEAIEAQAARLPLEVVIEADPALRGVRYPAQVETATWYVVSEALTNAVKHARARRVHVALAQPDGHLAVEVRDDGCGFDQATMRGLGLASLADRMAIVDGALRVDSSPGRGTTLRAEVPLTAAGAGDG